jgi:Ni/Co efflux regulator RcnB
MFVRGGLLRVLAENVNCKGFTAEAQRTLRKAKKPKREKEKAKAKSQKAKRRGHRENPERTEKIKNRNPTTLALRALRKSRVKSSAWRKGHSKQHPQRRRNIATSGPARADIR